MALSQYKRLSGCFGSLFRAASVHLAVRRMRSLTEAHISSVQRLPQQQRMRIDMHYMRNLAQPTGASTQYSQFLRHQLNKNFVPAPDQGESGTCYAHAIASATHSALLRIVGRDGGYPDFEDIRDDIIHKFEYRDTHSNPAVLRYVSRKYGLRYERVPFPDAREAVRHGRAVVASFSLSAQGWQNFDDFFHRRRRGVLRRKHIKRLLSSGDGFANESQEGQEVTFISDNDDIDDDNVVDVGGQVMWSHTSETMTTT